ncbi:Beta-galactoside alpha-2,6-sialyltransferase 2 [Eumeta japonica]|uniref:Beta-galactoside alpha-2,6-sialyltransferase 2 n=1 Tax=Eumeta variegata TaxID=151549 RepID=A0A4C1U4M5_EUMVA|nr:Beta-galactoside alpha-2,6-sialyltransferase 2 [Eumeta japonica]
MRGAAISVWIFINLLCFGMCGYLYLIWSQYWMYIEKQRLFSKPAAGEGGVSGGGRGGRDAYGSDNYVHNYYAFVDGNASAGLRKNRRSAVGTFRRGGRIAKAPARYSVTQPRPSTNVVLKSNGSPRFPNVHRPVLEFDTDKYVCYDLNEPECDAKTAEYKELLLKEFHRVLMVDSNVFESGVDSKNPYNVQYAGERSGVRREKSDRELLCALRRVPVGAVSARDEPFRSRGFRIPAGAPLAGRAFNTCAVVSSAGALLGSQLGQFIGNSYKLFIKLHIY